MILYYIYIYIKRPLVIILHIPFLLFIYNIYIKKTIRYLYQHKIIQILHKSFKVIYKIADARYTDKTCEFVFVRMFIKSWIQVEVFNDNISAVSVSKKNLKDTHTVHVHNIKSFENTSHV